MAVRIHPENVTKYFPKETFSLESFAENGQSKAILLIPLLLFDYTNSNLYRFWF